MYNFISLQVIAEMDEYVYCSLRNESLKKLSFESIQDRILIVKHTTSSQCMEHELSTVVDENGKKRPLKVTFESRTRANKIEFVIYKILRCWFVSFVVYFQPFVVIFASVLLPNMHLVTDMACVTAI